MELKNFTTNELALFLEDKLPEDKSVDLVTAINDVQTLWELGEMTMSE